MGKLESLKEYLKNNLGNLRAICAEGMKFMNNSTYFHLPYILVEVTKSTDLFAERPLQ